MNRFFRWLKALFNRGMDKLEDPDIMLDQAKREMTEALLKNKEKAVQAIAQRNMLQAELENQRKRAAAMEIQATTALKGGNRDLARQILREKTSIDASIESLQGTMAQAEQTVEQVKIAIKRQEDEVRKKTADALALKAQWKQAQIQDSINKTLSGLTFENEYEGSFAAARDRIGAKQAEASARGEMFSGSVQGQMMNLQDQAADALADDELRKLEERLGMGTTAPVTETVSNNASTSVDAQLEELEKRLNQGQQ